ncbi:MAG TPA: hypothetical protein PKA88_12850 [Polyangiaceae bacterium]|nr:hypothetical protein [Polyangiaceae bacterium]
MLRHLAFAALCLTVAGCSDGSSSDGAGGSAGASGSGASGTGASGGAAGSGGSAGSGAAGSGGAGGAVSPDKLPLLAVTDLEYQGALRLPSAEFGVSSLNFSEGPLVYNPKNDSIFIVGHDHQQAIAEFKLPALKNSTTLSDLNMAAPPMQSFVTVLDRVSANPQAIDQISGLALFDGPGGQELLVHAYEYYDAPADNTHTTLVLRDASDLAGSSVDGFYAFGGAAHAAGWVSPVPSVWQSLLGGTTITGASSGVPIIGRLSVGPSAFIFDPADVIGSATPGSVATTALLDFSLAKPLHDDLSNDTKTNDLWTHLSRANYGFVAPGTRSYVTLGSSGGHKTGVCYKCTPTGASQACGGYCSNDTSDNSNYYWFWDVNDLVKVKDGQLDASAVRPHAHGEFATPFSGEIGGGSFDPASGLLYLTLQGADTEQGQYANPPVVVAYKIKSK